MAATKDVINTYHTDVGYGTYPVAASAEIYVGSMVGENAAGYARPLQSGDKFLGFAEDWVDNSSGVAGAENIVVKRKGCIVYDVTGATILSNDRPDVYASDSNTMTQTVVAGSKVGRVLRWVTGTSCIVEFES